MDPKPGKKEDRWGIQKALALRIVRTTTRILPDDEGVAVRFINQAVNNSPTLGLSGIEQAIDSVHPKEGHTDIGMNLEKKILEPLVYNELVAGTLKRPLLVSIITDGEPQPEANEKLASVIVKCGDRLVSEGYPRDSRSFFFL